MADLGGVTIAYAAYQKSLAGKPAPVIDGFTGPQRFFIGFAQVWRGSIRPADQRLLFAHRSALSHAIPHAGAAVEHPGLLRRLRREAGRRHVSPERRPRRGLVNVCIAAMLRLAGEIDSTERTAAGGRNSPTSHFGLDTKTAPPVKTEC